MCFYNPPVEGAAFLCNPTVTFLFDFTCVFSIGKTFSCFKIQKAQKSIWRKPPSQPCSRFPSPEANMTPVPYDSFQRYPVYSKQSHTHTHTHPFYLDACALVFSVHLPR